MRFSFEAGGRDFSRVRATVRAFGCPTIADHVRASKTGEIPLSSSTLLQRPREPRTGGRDQGT